MDTSRLQAEVEEEDESAGATIQVDIFGGAYCNCNKQGLQEFPKAKEDSQIQGEVFYDAAMAEDLYILKLICLAAL